MDVESETSPFIRKQKRKDKDYERKIHEAKWERRVDGKKGERQNHSALPFPFVFDRLKLKHPSDFLFFF